MFYRIILALYLSIISINSYAQIEKEPVNEMVESSFSGYYDIPRDKIATIISNIKEKDKFLLHTLNEEDEISILSQEQANKYFFEKYRIKNTSPIITLREPDVLYNSDLEITSVNSQVILLKNFYNIFGNIPKTYNLLLVGKDNQYYPIDTSSFEKKRQFNFYTDYEGADYNLHLLPNAKNIYIKKASNIYPFRSNLNYYFNFDITKVKPKVKIFLEEIKLRGQSYNNFYIDYSNDQFMIEIMNIDLKKDTIYFLNTYLDKLEYEINDQMIRFDIKDSKQNILKTVILKNYISNNRNIKLCESDKCTSRFITLEEFFQLKK